MFLEAEWMIFHRKFLSIMQEGFRQPTCVPTRSTYLRRPSYYMYVASSR